MTRYKASIFIQTHKRKRSLQSKIVRKVKIGSPVLARSGPVNQPFGLADNIFILAGRGSFCFDLSKSCSNRWCNRLKHVDFNKCRSATRRTLSTYERGPPQNLALVNQIKINRTVFTPQFGKLVFNRLIMEWRNFFITVPFGCIRGG